VAIVARREEALAEAKADILAAAPGATVVTVSADVSTAGGGERRLGAVAGLGGLDIGATTPARRRRGRSWASDVTCKRTST
jgi:hypothetical protein